MLTPIVRGDKLYEKIINQFVRLIKDGKLKQGDKLPPERKLVEELNVSRTVLREALRAMEVIGIIESSIGKGTYVSGVSVKNILALLPLVYPLTERINIEMLEFRMMLETTAARIAASRIDNKKILDINESFKIMIKEIKEGKIGLEGDNEFHNSIGRATDNSAIIMILNVTHNVLSKTRKETLELPNQPEKTIKDHDKIRKAVIEGKANLAENLMRDHLLKAYKNLCKKYNIDHRKFLLEEVARTDEE